MLYSIDSGEYLDYIPHDGQFQTWRARLTDEEHDAIIDELLSRVDGDEVATSSWIPGADWSDTAFHPIWEKACRRNFESAARFFGLLVWEAFLGHPDAWGFGRYEKDGIPIEGMAYFKLKPPPPKP